MVNIQVQQVISLILYSECISQAGCKTILYNTCSTTMKSMYNAINKFLITNW